MSTAVPSAESSLAQLLRLPDIISMEQGLAALVAQMNALAATTGLVPTIFVAASDALPNSRLLAAPEYRCDGTADDVQIQAGIAALPT